VIIAPVAIAFALSGFTILDRRIWDHRGRGSETEQKRVTVRETKFKPDHRITAIDSKFLAKVMLRIRGRQRSLPAR